MKCPVCQTELKEGYKFCPKCGAALEGENAVQGKTIVMPDLYGDHTCPHCGHFLPDGCPVCDYCGAQVSAAQDEDAPVPEKEPPIATPPKKAKRGGLIVAAVVLAAAAVGLAVWLGRPDPEQRTETLLSQPTSDAAPTDAPSEAEEEEPPEQAEAENGELQEQPETHAPQEQEQPEEPGAPEPQAPATPDDETLQSAQTEQQASENMAPQDTPVTENQAAPEEITEEVEWEGAMPEISPPFSAPDTPANPNVNLSRSDAAIIAWDYWDVYTLLAKKAEDESYTVYIEADPTDEDPCYMVCIRYYKTGQPVAPVMDRIYINSETGEVTSWI